MNSNTRSALINFVREVSKVGCNCTMKERDSGHRVDCDSEYVERKAEKLINALQSDETII